MQYAINLDKILAIKTVFNHNRHDYTYKMNRNKSIDKENDCLECYQYCHHRLLYNGKEI